MRRSIRIALALPVFIFIIFLIYNLIYLGTIYPNIYVAGINLGGMKPEVATQVLIEKIKPVENIKLVGPENSFDLKATDIDVSYDFAATAQRVYELTRTGNILYDLQQKIELLMRQKHVGLSTRLNEEKLSKVISVISEQISIEPVNPSVKIINGDLIVNKGISGTEVDSVELRANIGRSLSFNKNSDIQIQVKQIGVVLTSNEAQEYKSRAKKYLGKNLKMIFEFATFDLSDKSIIELLDPKDGFYNEMVGDHIFKIAKEINRDPQNPKFEFANGHVSEFLPAKDGIELDVTKFKDVLYQNLVILSNSELKSIEFDIPAIRTPPETSTDEVNNLGIKELIGRGTSKFKGSIPSRVHNIQLASSHLNGILIKPGETFSFNESLGDVSKFTGYKEAYVIREGKTVLGDGGGVCQVSTTLFRAVLDAGLPIIERQAHAYRVGYYEQDSGPGLDATVYGPTPDLKIKNDTPGHILIQAKTDTKNYSLIFELYGTSDGRVATITKPVTVNVVAPGDDLYIDDPTLSIGVVKQTEHRANGAKVSFNYLVQRAGETLYKKTFISNYRPWQAVYLRGTGLQ
ncbi:MAG: VanW family protein [Patescibacteria group bacterium]